MTVIEKQYMDAVIAMNRKMADQNKVDWERYRMDAAQNVANLLHGLYLTNRGKRQTYLCGSCGSRCKMANALVTELQNNPLNTKTTEMDKERFKAVCNAQEQCISAQKR